MRVKYHRPPMLSVLGTRSPWKEGILHWFGDMFHHAEMAQGQQEVMVLQPSDFV